MSDLVQGILVAVIVVVAIIIVRNLMEWEGFDDGEDEGFTDGDFVIQYISDSGNSEGSKFDTIWADVQKLPLMKNYHFVETKLNTNLDRTSCNPGSTAVNETTSVQCSANEAKGTRSSYVPQVFITFTNGAIVRTLAGTYSEAKNTILPYSSADEFEKDIINAFKLITDDNYASRFNALRENYDAMVAKSAGAPAPKVAAVSKPILKGATKPATTPILRGATKKVPCKFKVVYVGPKHAKRDDTIAKLWVKMRHVFPGICFDKYESSKVPGAITRLVGRVVEPNIYLIDHNNTVKSKLNYSTDEHKLTEQINTWHSL